jgi:hypothetical protein
MLQLSVNLCKEARDKFWNETGKFENGRMKPLVAASIGLVLNIFSHRNRTIRRLFRGWF